MGTPNRREFIVGTSALISSTIAGCSGGGSGVQDSDGDGVIDSEDYAPKDSEVQQKADIHSEKQTEQSTSTPTDRETTTEQSVQARIGEVDVDIQMDMGQNNIGFDVETYFKDSATLTVAITDGEASDQRSFDATTTDGFQEFNDDIDPPDTFQDDEDFVIKFTLTVDGSVADEKTLRGTYSE